MTGFPRLKSTLMALAAATVFSGAASAQTAAAPAATPEWALTGNVGLYSQYVFRGLTQTNEKPAIQGGFDVAHKSGFYLGTWASNASWVADFVPSVSNSMEWDFYGGFKGSLPADFGYDLGVLYYWYPGGFDNGNYEYTDWRVGASTEIYGLTVGIYGTGTDADAAYYTNVYGKNISKNQFVAYVQKTF